MDSSHKLDAPNNDELRAVNQLEDRSELTTIYREAGEQFEGEILSLDERKKAKAEQLEAITSGLGKYSLKIGLFIPWPFVGGLLLAVAIYMITQLDNLWLLTASIFIAGAVWIVSSYKAYASIFKIFYNHALRAGPFLFVMLISLMMASQAIYTIVAESFSTQSLAVNSALISLLIVMYSLVATFIMLGVWGNSRLKSATKLAVSTFVIGFSAFFVISTYLF